MAGTIANGKSKSQGRPDVAAMTRSDHIAAFMECIGSMPSQQHTSRPRKRARTTRVVDSICIARESISVTYSGMDASQESSTITRTDAGQLVDIRLCSMDSEIPDAGGWQLSLKPRASYRGRRFALMLPLDDSMVTQGLKTALRVAEVHASNPGEESCLWAGVDISVRQIRESNELHLSTEVRWNERLTVWGSDRSKSNVQQTLRDEALETWYPHLYQASSKPHSWSPQDFYEAACVPSKEGLDGEVSSMEIAGLEAVLYPFQRRAVQWLLRREGVQWHRDTPSKQTAIRPFIPPVSPDLPVSFAGAKDADGNTIYISPLLGAATKDTSIFQPFQDLRGGILAEEMGLGKTLEVIALILLHQRPESPPMVFDPILGRELLTTSATLIVAPSSLLDQWLSELNRHAPGLKVVFYPGIKEMAKLKGENELSVEKLAQQNAVVTTYDVLRKEIWAASDEPTRSMRNEQQYERVKSPLVQLSWWRVCIDEAQMVENWANNAAKLARKIPRINAWGVTGTPVKDDIQKDLRGLLLFLRHEPYASDTKTWNFLTTFDKESFRKIFNSISMRHSKSLVRNEIDIPPQKRYVITMPFTAVEDQHYQSLFEELAGTCGLDARGNPLQADWDPEDPEVQRSMRAALDRLRQTVLHPEVGNRNRRGPGQKTGPMRTVAEVLDAMLEQTDSSVRTDQRAFLSAGLLKGQILACQGREQDALDVWREVAAKCSELVDEGRAQLEQEIQEARRTKSGEDSEADSDGEDREDAVPQRVGEARRRLRLSLEVQHKAVFFCANAYFSIKTNKEMTTPDSDEFKRLEKLEVEAYDRAKDIRREILRESHGKAAKLMGRLMKAAVEQSFAVVPAFEPIDLSGIESRTIADALEVLFAGLNEQAAEIDDWREHVIQLLLKPLVDEENDEITGEEYEQSAKLQDEILVYLQVLRTALAYRNSSITGQKNFLVEHETKAAARRARAAEGPLPGMFLALLGLCEDIKPPFVEGDPLTSVRGLVSELRALSAKLQHDAGAGSSRSAKELAVVSVLLSATSGAQKEQAKAVTAMEKETERFMDTLNARIEYYRQLQEVSDTVAEYDGSLDPDELNAALIESEKYEERLEKQLDAGKSKHRYLVFLKHEESNSGEQRMCIICQSNFEVGVLTVCGHLFCKECIMLWLRAHRNCPMCKKKLHQYNLYDITLKPQELRVHSERQQGSGDGGKDEQSTPSKKVSAIYSDFSADELAVIKNIDLDGPSFTTKVDMLTRHLMWLRDSDPGAKSIIFSQYKEFLDVLALAFQRYRIGYTSFDKAHGIAIFKEDPGTEVFLLHARAHASGLNLVNANHVFLCEPLLNTALELQAIARVDRIGQQHGTTVWLYIVDGTVEESIHDLSVQRRMEHMGENTKGKSKGSASEPLDAQLEEANALEMQQANLSKLMGKDGILGEAVDKDALWTCLFGHLYPKGRQGEREEERDPANPEIRRLLTINAAERRMEGEGEGEN